MVDKIDSNSVGLSIAEQTNRCDLPVTPVWYEQEPNEFQDFGGEAITEARTPIKRSRQRTKGTVVDLNASANFNMDYTETNFDRVLQGFFFANWREKATTAPLNSVSPVAITTATASSDVFAAAAGLAIFKPGMLVKGSGFTVAANNGVFTVVSALATGVTVAAGVADEAPPAGAALTNVGIMYGAGDVEMTVAGAVPSLEFVTPAVAAEGNVAFGGAGGTDTITIDGVTYTFDATPTNPYEINPGANATASALALANAINGNVLGTPVHPTVSAVASGTDCALTARVPGAWGNLIAASETGTTMTITAFADGDGNSWNELGLIPGEWIFVGGDAAGTFFTDRRGYARVHTITDDVLILDKTTFDPGVGAAGTVTLHVYTGAVLKNEDEPVYHYYQAERRLGNDDDGPQAEYVKGAVANELNLQISASTRLSADLSFVGSTVEFRKGVDGLKAGTRVAAKGEDAINAALDVYRLRMSIVDPATSLSPTLFGYITEGELAINNNVTGIKVVGILGNLDVNVGTFEVGGELTAIFNTVAACEAVMENADVTLDIIIAKDNTAKIWDMPLIGLGNGIPDVQPGEPITVPLDTDAYENEHGFTLMNVVFDYVPDAGMPTVGDC